VSLTDAATGGVRTDTQAVVSIVLGILSLPSLVFPPGGALGIAAIVVGVMARHRITRSEGRLKGQRIAIAGIILGALGTLMALVLPAFLVGVLIWSLFHGGRLPEGA